MGIADKKVAEVEKNQYNVKSVSGSRLQGTTRENKNVFDRLVEFLTGRFNDVIDDLISITEGNSGADNIGAAAMAEDGAKSVGGQLRELKILVDGKVDSDDSEIFSEDEKTKLLSVERNANYYVLPVASSAVMGGVKQGVGVEILADGTINGLSAPAPDLYAREEVLREAEKRAAADESLFNQVEAIALMAATVPVPTAATQIIISDLSNVSEPKYKTIGFAAAKAKPVSNFKTEKVKSLGDLPIGSRVKDIDTTYYGEPIVWVVADKNHSGYPANSVTLVAEKILTIKCFDGKEPSNTDSNRRQYGNNRYIYANMRRWLNSDAGAGAWYAAQHSADAPPTAANCWESHNPYDTQAGFLNTFSTNFRNALLTTTLTVASNAVTDGGSSETLTDKLFLASNTEVGLANENSIVEGAKLALFSDNASRLANPTAQAVSNSTYKNANLTTTKPWAWWPRTPYASNSSDTRLVYSDGVLSISKTYSGCFGVRPLCNLLSSVLVAGNTDADGCYNISFKSKGLLLSWQNPIDVILNQDTVIRRSDESYPATITDGVEVYRGTAESYIDASAGTSINQYYSAFGDNGIMPSDAVNADGEDYEQLVNYTMLYDQGDECTAVTGGWIFKIIGKPTYIKNAYNIYMRSSGSGNDSQIVSGGTVDLAEYKQICAKINCVMTGSGQTYLAIAETVTDWAREATIKIHTEVTFTGVLKLDISNVSQKYIKLEADQSGGTNETYVYNLFATKPDDWQTLCTKAGVTAPSTLEALIADTAKLTAIFANEGAISYMTSRCTGDFMTAVLNDINARVALKASPYLNKVIANIHWAKFMMILAPELLNYIVLYDSGEENEVVTGGWRNNNSNAPNTTITKSDKIKIRVSSGTQVGTAGVISANKINFSGYAKLAIVVPYFKSTLLSGLGLLTSLQNITSTNLGEITRTNPLTNSDDSGIIYADITSIASQYLFTGIWSGTITPTFDMDIAGMFMLKHDDWQQWITSAGFDPTSYADLHAVLMDAFAVSTLMASKSACEYLMGCTGDLMLAICNSQMAMSALVDNIAYDYAFDHPVWYKFMTMIPTSLAAMDSVAVKIPTMTSNVAPSGVASCTNYYLTHDAYKAFQTDGDMSAPSSAQMCFAISVVEGTWNVAYAFDNPVDVYKVRFGITPATQEVTNVSAKLQTSIDGETWQDVTNVKDSPLQANSFVSFVECLKKPILVKHIRVLCIRRASSSASRNGFGAVLQVYGKAVD